VTIFWEAVAMDMSSPGKQTAFTLIELLVVVAIIVTLIALLVPSLGRAKDKSKATVCLSNLKGMDIAFHLYAQEHDDLMPPVQNGAPTVLGAPIDTSIPTNPSSGTDNYMVNWFGGQGSVSFSSQYGLLTAYWGQASINGCPSISEADYSNTSSGYRLYYGPCNYAYNEILGGATKGLDGAELLRKVGAINSPAGKALVWDSSRLAGTSLFSRTPWGYPVGIFGTTSSEVDPNVHGRHLNRMANVAYVDGHAEQVKPYVLSDWTPLATKSFILTPATLGPLDVQYNIGFIYDGPNPPSSNAADLNKYYDPTY
jgi:prepilin-type processing-associated H-X9-DG protein/prepilin-type N-terminal cleavage/methylation domain-containing protein